MTKKLLSFAIFVIAIIAISNLEASSQTLYFAEGVDADGYPITESSVFNISRNGSYLYALVRLPYTVECRSVKYVIYRDGDYDNTIYQDTEKNWTWFWQKINFYKTGLYDFYIYDCYDNLLTSGSVRINYK